MNLIRTLRKTYLLLFLILLTVFMSCDLNKEKRGNVLENNQVAFYSQKDSSMYSIDLDNNNKRKLFTLETARFSEVNWPALSPDGNKIAYADERNGVYGVYYYDLKLKKHVKFWEGYYIRDGPVSGGIMDWHKDLGPILAIKEFEIRNLDTYVLKDSLFKTFEKGNLKTYDYFKLRDTAYINLTNNKSQNADTPPWNTFVAAHSNGNISFWALGFDEEKGDLNRTDLNIVNLNRKDKRRIFDLLNIGFTGQNMWCHDISEDGKWLLFSTDGDIVLIELENPANIINLTNSKDQVDIMPKFNSDDTKIVHSSGDGKKFNIFTMNFDGGNKQAHTTGNNHYIHSRYKLDY